MPSLGGWELLILVGVLVLLFGAKKLPDTARAVGRSMRIFKAETKGMRQDEEQAPAAPEQPAAPQSLPPAQPAQPAPQATSAPSVPAAAPAPAPAQPRNDVKH
ncbi:Sec-independent protein translocase subunit TatA [Streptoalloteichus hindustanus]|uniref:Sec-independent protein translocase protein TatA n=1 Tax=Streptoalloteichus hindustanus TaxID=2017 RepID=A0A1M4YJ34_STRHI|nr:Sec-independent protein translocase subunit TatA [Streptoalloteichus hindustanus]SHF05648.1 sec-independent protein translocase protein TatA [Streptoalloteichus hindustanus]